MCWLLLVIWFECKISRTISNPRLEITCFNPVELTPQRQGGKISILRNPDCLMCLMGILQWRVVTADCCCDDVAPAVSPRRHQGLLLTIHPTPECEGLVSVFILVIWETDILYIRFYKTWLGPSGRQIWRDPRTDISQQPHTIICRYIQPDSTDSNSTEMITGPNIPPGPVSN